MENRNILADWRELPVSMRPKVRYWLPAAAMEESDLRQEIRQLAERGFGGMEVVVLATLPEEIAKSEDGWGTSNWDRMVGIVDEEAKKLGMSMDLAIGPGWPIASPAIDSADDPAALYELVWGEMTVEKGTHYAGPVPERRIIRPEGTPKLVHVLAYLEQERDVLIRSSYIDLRVYVKEGQLEYDFPDGEGTVWKVYAYYSQPSCHKINSGQTYAIDHLSVAGAKACEAYWDKVLSENTYDTLESFFCDSLEYNVAMDWTPEFLQEFERRRGYSILPYLPFIGEGNLYPACDLAGCRLDEEEVSLQVNRDYTETLTQCYCENHLAALETMAEKYGKTIRYQVAYNKPFEEERSALYVAIPENEALGRAFLDGQKLMAAAVHLGRKERYSFECAAQFGHSYGQCYEDLMWWVKRSLMAGMNAQVLHGAGYSGQYEGKHAVDGQVPGTAWPGYEPFGKFVSNYWNRTLSVEDARGCLDAVTRWNVIFRKQAKVDCAVFRCSYTNDGTGNDFDYYGDGGMLVNRGYSYELVSDALLHLPVCQVDEGILDKDGVGYQALIIPEQDAVSVSFLKKTMELAAAGLAVIWQGKRPGRSLFFKDVDTREKQAYFGEILERCWSSADIIHVDSLEEVPEVLGKRHIRARMELEGTSDLMTALRVQGGKRYYVLYSYNRVSSTQTELNPDEISVSALYKKGTTKPTYERPGASSRRKVKVRLQGTGAVSICNPWDGTRIPADFVEEEGYMSGTVFIEEDEMIVFLLEEQQSTGAGGHFTAGHVCAERMAAGQGEGCFAAEQLPMEETDSGCTWILADRLPVRFDSLELESFEPDTGGECSFLRSGFVKTGRIFCPIRLLPWKNLSPELVTFSGRGIYKGSMEIPDWREGNRYLLQLGDVCDTFRVYVNGEETAFPDQVMKRVDVTGLVRKGSNSLEVVVTSNLYNRLFSPDTNFFGMPVPYLPRRYGIWESPGKCIALYVYKEQENDQAG